jgi:hypothetical protein
MGINPCKMNEIYVHIKLLHRTKGEDIQTKPVHYLLWLCQFAPTVERLANLYAYDVQI